MQPGVGSFAKEMDVEFGEHAEVQKISFPVPITTSRPIRKMMPMIHNRIFMVHL